MKLSYTEELFVAEYLKDGNGTRAYLAIKPNSSERAAAVSANRLLKKPAVMVALQGEVERKIDVSIASRANLIQEAHDVKERAKKSDKLQVELNSIDLKGKLAGIYKELADDNTGFMTLLQSITINVDEKEDNQKTIDITPESED
jgi:phage terminase small subunit